MIKVMYIIIIFFSSLHKWQTGKLSAYAGVCEMATIHHISDLESDPESRVFFILCLRGETI